MKLSNWNRKSRPSQKLRSLVKRFLNRLIFAIYRFEFSRTKKRDVHADWLRKIKMIDLFFVMKMIFRSTLARWCAGCAYRQYFLLYNTWVLNNIKIRNFVNFQQSQIMIKGMKGMKLAPNHHSNTESKMLSDWIYLLLILLLKLFSIVYGSFFHLLLITSISELLDRENHQIIWNRRQELVSYTNLKYILLNLKIN